MAFITIPQKLKAGGANSVKSFGAIWLLIEAPSALYEPIKDFFQSYDGYTLTISLLLVIVYAIYKSLPPKSVTFQLRETETNVTIKSGDLFDQTGVIAIPVNEYFDSQVDDTHVHSKSIHGQFIKNVLNGDSNEFDKQVKASLNGLTSETILEKTSGKQRRFPLGTTATISTNGKKFLPFALAATDINNYEASASMPQFTQALNGFWGNARSKIGHDTLCIPLVGGGLSRTNIGTHDRLELILLSLLAQTRNSRVADQVNIVLFGQDKDDVDLNAVQKKWS